MKREVAGSENMRIRGIDYDESLTIILKARW